MDIYFESNCYLIAIVLLIIVTVLPFGIYDEFTWKWLNILCKTILIGATIFVIVLLLALLVWVILKYIL